MRKSLVFILLLFSIKIFGQSNCFENKEHPLPAASEQTKKLYELKLAEAIVDYNKDSTNAEAIIWLGRRIAYTGNYKKAIEIFSKGIALHPTDARLYRHRGHRYITLRCFDKAIADFKKAASLIKGKPDEVEPDGLPNAQNTPTSTLQSNIWYHLGLCYYINGDFKKARAAYRKCLLVSKNNDMYVATTNWLYITLLRLGKFKQADELLQTINADMKLIENNDYQQVLMLYKQRVDFADPVQYLQKDKKDLGLASFGFGLGNYLLNIGEREKALKVFQLIVDSKQWAAFGFIGAEVELNRIILR